MEFEERLEKNGKKVIESIMPNEKVFVMISKIYGVADPVLNMGIPEKLMEMGYRVLPFYDLPEMDMEKEHPNMYWPFIQHVLEPAKFIKNTPNMYAVYLTHHGCGPDSASSHYFRQEMGDKPYLHIEVDEHSSPVGVITRVEAFVNSLESQADEGPKAAKLCTLQEAAKVNIKGGIGDIKPGSRVYIHHMYPYSQIFKEILASQGINAHMMPQSNVKSVDKGRKHAAVEEYFSLISALGDVLQLLKENEGQTDDIAFLIPQNEGAEVEGQYGRFIRAKLDEEGFENVEIASPFVEDFLCGDEDQIKLLLLGIIAGDVVRTADAGRRQAHIDYVADAIRSGRFGIGALKEMASSVAQELREQKYSKKILAVGECAVIYNDFMNDFTFRSIEEKGHKVVYSPFSEYMWLMWKDYCRQNEREEKGDMLSRLEEFKGWIKEISDILSDFSPFEGDMESLSSIADSTVGYYAGANGRYRQAKILCDLPGIDGIVTAASMYENTGIVLNALHRGFEGECSKPVLNLTFDGNKNENDQTKIESFLYYI